MQLARFNNVELRVIETGGRKAFSAEEIGSALEYSEPRKNINKLFNRYRDEFEKGVDYGVTKLTIPGR